VPSAISDNVLKYAGNYRSRARIPALTYLHPVNNCSITRSSQPLVGLRRNRSLQDEKLVEAICASNRPNTQRSSQTSVNNDSSSNNLGGSQGNEQSNSLSDQQTGSQPEDQNGSQSNINGQNEANNENISTDEITASLSKGPSVVVIPSVRAPSEQASGTSVNFSESELVEDEAIKAVTKVYGSQQNNLIVDARPTVNAYAMQAKGAGSEDMQYYACATKAYLGIDNIHVMRKSLDRVIDALKDSDIHTLPLDQDQLMRSGWLKHIANMLDGTALIARTVGINHSHVLIHCSDGWDRTSQLSALSQICLDPYYRTMEGFMVLVEKDWLSFGHMFRHRAGPLGSEKWFEIEGERIAAPSGTNGATGSTSSTSGSGSALENTRSRIQGFFRKTETQESTGSDEENPLDPTAGTRSASHARSGPDDKIATKIDETSPVFHQFLDATYQLLYQYPARFEFNERFLCRLLYHLYSCQYGSFLYDNEKERKEANAKEKTRSVWDYFLLKKEDFMNDKYDPEIDDHNPMKERLIFPKKESVRWWAKGFGRVDDEMNVPGVGTGYSVASQTSSVAASQPVLTGLETADESIGIVPGSRQTRPVSRIAEGTNALAATMASFGLGGGGSKPASPSPHRRPRSPRVAIKDSDNMEVEMQ
jgi:myotubularin-related protein 6/7/8